MTRLECALGPDSAGTLLTRLLGGARRRIDASVYEVGPSYRWALVQAIRRGVRLRLVLDAHASDGNAETAREVLDAGGACRVSGEGAGAAHAKLLIIDGGTLAVGTGNLVWRDSPRDPHLALPPASPPLSGTREWWAFASGAFALRRTAQRRFDALWKEAVAPPAQWAEAQPAGAPPVGRPLPQVPPLARRVAGRRVTLVTGGAAIARETEAMISGSSSRVLVTSPYVHAATLAVSRALGALIDAFGRGAECGLLLGGRPAPAESARLARLPFAVRWMDPSRSTSGHAKGVVADSDVLVSSANWSAHGLGGNWEAALRIHDAAVAAYYAAAWRRDWDSAVPLGV